MLSRAGATDYDAIRGMFELSDLRLAGVMCVAMALGALGFWSMRRGWVKSSSGAKLTLTTKPMTSLLPLGALLFGVGWALAGTCPGTALTNSGTSFGGNLVGSSGNPRSLAVGASDTICVQATLPTTAASSLQGQTSNVTLTFRADQLT